jgi:hypothetical protein
MQNSVKISEKLLDRADRLDTTKPGFGLRRTVIRIKVRKLQGHMTKTTSFTLALSAAVLGAISAKADAIAYDNTATAQKNGGDLIYSSPSAPGNKEFGDEINLLGGANTVTRFQFEYLYTGTAGDGATGVLRFYDMAPAGAGFTVGNLLLQSTPFALANGSPDATGGYQGDTGAISVAVPGRFVWSVELNPAAGATGGLLLYNGAGVGNGPGESADNHWEKSLAGTWTLYNYALGVDNFNARVTVVPEPGTMALIGLGSFGMLALARRRKA